jgi:antitoxin Phd
MTIITRITKIAKKMKILGASEAKNRFGQLLDLAIREPVQIEKKGRKVAVMLSIEEFERLSNLEDELWALKAEKAKEEGFMGTELSENLLEDLLNAEC